MVAKARPVATQSPPPYVAVADPTRWAVRHGSGLRRELSGLGLKRPLFGSVYALKPERPLSFAEMARLAAALRDLGVKFSAGRDWSPAEVARNLRERGLFQGAFEEIHWTGDGWQLRTV